MPKSSHFAKPAPLAKQRWIVTALAAVLLTLAACEQKPPAPSALPDGLLLTPVGFDQLPGWDADSLAEALPALKRSCDRLLKGPQDAPVGPAALGGSVADWRVPCGAIGDVATGDEAGLRALIQAHFVAFRAANKNGRDGLFTGYYEAELRGARKPDQTYRWPLYRRPGDLVRVNLARFRTDFKDQRIVGQVVEGALVPYFARSEIDAGALAGRGLELIWVDDPVDAFFLHVQGSGQVRLDDGETLRVGFAASNGLEFYAIGRALIDEGQIKSGDVSMQSIRDWLRVNPAKAQEVMARNKRYIFFREIDGAGPIGAQGVALTAGRSLAVDPGFIPLGAPIWLDTTWPGSDRPLRRLMVAQDTGNAIKGPVRGDLFWGFGEPALAQAGRMRSHGGYYLLLPKAVAERRAKTT